jgi:NitT/TauT family transport system permease protein
MASTFFKLHHAPSRFTSVCYSLLPFAIMLLAYVICSELRLADNAKDKLLPSLSTLFDTAYRMAFEADRRTGEYLLFNDTIASLTRLLIGVGAATVTALLVGLNMGLHKGARMTFGPFVVFLSMIPPLSILPILLISFGVGEAGKIMLIFIGTVLIMTRDVMSHTAKMPIEMIVKSMTLGVGDYSIVYRIVLPQIMPKLLDSLRLCLGAAWLFLIAAEAIASSEGLGYRIFLSRRYLAMDVIITYVMWITFLGFFLDYGLQQIIKRCYPWYHKG